LDHLFQTDVKATRIEFRALWRGEADCAVAARAFKSLRDKASTTAADAVFDTVVLPLYGAVEGVSPDDWGTPGRGTVSPVDVR
jgi:hypothetical protein